MAALPDALHKALPTGSVAFLMVGATAAGVHYLVALALNGLLGVTPGWANTLAFMSAFPVSYFGHRLLSFPQTRLPHAQALPRFATVAVSSFVGNQAMLLALLNWLHWPFWLALGICLVTVAAATYVLSRFWAFK